jgi:ribonuclease R
MISIRDMKDDYYNFDEIHHQLKGQRGGKVFRLAIYYLRLLHK